MKKTLITSLVLASLFLVAVPQAHAQYGGGISLPGVIHHSSGDFAPSAPSSISSFGGEVLGAFTVSPEIQARIDELKAKLRLTIAQLIELLKLQLAAAQQSGSY